MHLLVASILPLLLGPALVWILQRARWAANAIDAFVLASVAGLIFLSIVPEAIVDGGLLAIVALTLGAFLPKLGRYVFSARSTARSAALLVGLLGLFVHACIDGIALAAPESGHGGNSPLAVAVVLHRLPVGLAIWWLVRPRLGLRVSAAAVFSICFASCLGFFFFRTSHEWMHGPALSAFQALVAGSLLHVAASHSDSSQTTKHSSNLKIPSAIGALLGLGIVALVSSAHALPHTSPSCLSFSDTFFSLACQSAPFLLVAYAVSALFRIALPNRFARWLRVGSPLALSPDACDCVPRSSCACTLRARFDSLVREGISPSSAIVFVLVSPILCVGSILVSFRWLGIALTAARIVSAIAFAVLAGVVLAIALAKISRSQPSQQEQPPQQSRLKEGLRYGFIEIPDRTLPWFSAGLIAAAMLESILETSPFEHIPQGLDIPIFAVLGMPLFLSSLGITPLVVVLIHKGVSVGAAIAFSITGSAVSYSTFTFLQRLHGRKLAVTYFVVVALGCIALGFATNAVFQGVSWPSAVSLLHESTRTSLEKNVENIALALVTLLAVGSLFRRGLHGFVSEVVNLHEHHHHDAIFAHEPIGHNGS